MRARHTLATVPKVRAGLEPTTVASGNAAGGQGAEVGGQGLNRVRDGRCWSCGVGLDTEPSVPIITQAR